jgi:hypothetical protein
MTKAVRFHNRRFTALLWYNRYWPKWMWSLFWFWKSHRIGYCENGYNGCGRWGLNRRQVINRSTSFAWLCEECADEEQKEVDAAWAEYYGGLL